MRNKSILWEPSREEFQNIVNKYSSIADILRHFGLHPGAGNYKTIKRRFKKESINIDHIALGLNSRLGKKFKAQTKPVKHYLVSNSKTQSTFIKKKVLGEGLLKEECSSCGIGPEWNGQKLSLQLDHIDGNSTNNVLKNLRILCPNCHSQTPTWGAKRTRKPKNHCIDCFKVVSRKSKRCLSCAGRLASTPEKISWPSNKELSKLVFQKPLIHLGSDLGVSDNAIRKRCKKFNINLPSRGYWLKSESGVGL